MTDRPYMPDDLKGIESLINRNHDDAKEQFDQLAKHIKDVDERVRHLEHHRLPGHSDEEIMMLVDQRLARELKTFKTEIQQANTKAIDDRMVYYGRRVLAVVTPAAVGYVFSLFS